MPIQITVLIQPRWRKKSNDKAKQMKLRLFKNNKKKNLRGEKNGHKNSAKMII